MNKRDKAIQDWVRIHRPDVAQLIDEILFRETGYNKSQRALMAMAFEAGRKLQAENPNLELDNPNVY